MQMISVMRKRVFGFPTRSDTNRAVHLPNMARSLKFRTKEVEEIVLSAYVMKTKALIATAQLICAFDFLYAKIRVSYDAAHIIYHDQFVVYNFSCDRLFLAPGFGRHHLGC